MIRTTVTATIVVALGALTGCANERGPYPNLPPLGAKAEFLAKNLCGEGVSPEILLSGVPANTATYRLRLTNVSVLRGPSWETTIKAGAPSIQEGAFSFDPPCPAEKQVFVYRLEVMALASNGQPLAYGWAFPSARALSDQMEQEQLELKRPLSDRPARTRPPAAQRPPFFTY